MRDIIHVFPNFKEGGAENQAIKLIKSNPDLRHSLLVLGSKIDESLSKKIPETTKIVIIQFNLMKLFLTLCKFRQVENLQIINWLYPTLIVSLIANLILRSSRLIVCLRNYDCRWSSIGLLNVFNLYCLKCAFIKNIIVVSNSYAALRSHAWYVNGLEQFVVANIYNISQFTRPSLSKNLNKIKVGYVSRNSFLKGVDYFIEFVNLTRNSTKFQFNFSVYGDGLNNQWFSEALLDKDDYRSVAIKAPYGDFKEISDFYDCFIITSRAESQPNIFFESVLSFVPVFSFDVGDLRIALGHDLSPYFIAEKHSTEDLYNLINCWFELDNYTQSNLLISAAERCNDYLIKMDMFDDIIRK